MCPLVVNCRINWNMPPRTDNEQQNAQATPNPMLDVKALIEEDAFCPLQTSTSSPQNDSSPSSSSTTDSFNLSKLIFLPPSPEVGSKNPTNAHTIIGVFTTVPPPPSQATGMMPDVGSQWGQANSVIARWEVHGGLQDRISSCFDQLSNKKKGTSGVPARVCSPFLSRLSTMDGD